MTFHVTGRTATGVVIALFLSAGAAASQSTEALRSSGAGEQIAAPLASLNALSGLAEAAEAAGGEVALFYGARGYEPVWAGSAGVLMPSNAVALVEAVENAGIHALPPERYGAAALRDRLLQPWDADAEIAFTQAYLQYARDVGSGVLEPRRLSRNMDVRPVRPEVHALLERLGSTEDAAALIEALPPQTDDYGALVAKYAAMRALAEREAPWAQPVAKGRSLSLGDGGARVKALRARLVAMGDLEPRIQEAVPLVLAANDVTADVPLDTGGDADARFDEALDLAVKRFQARHGLNQDGVVGPATLAALNAEPGERARQVAVNLERARWNHTRMSGPRIVANLPDYRVHLWREGPDPVYETRVVIGRYKHQTVEFSDEMDHMVVNPTWFVPSSIARGEILPKLRENPNYLAERNFTLHGSDLPASEIFWELIEPADFPGRLRQGPGPGNALGKVKFMFPNDHAIYLHDTPQRSLFRRDNRAYSHGCVRVEKPAELAAVLLEGQVEDPEASFAAWVRRGSERYIKLDQKLPVHLVYRTTWVAGDGAQHFRRDVYRRDALLAKALTKLGVDLPG